MHMQIAEQDLLIRRRAASKSITEYGGPSGIADRSHRVDARILEIGGGVAERAGRFVRTCPCRCAQHRERGRRTEHQRPDIERIAIHGGAMSIWAVLRKDSS